jgi:hypothetical protein
MKDKLSIIALVAIVAVSAGLIGYTSTSGEVSPATSFASSALVSGQMTLELRDSEGNLKAYRQTDNVITRNGEDCVAKALFAPDRYNSGGSSSGTTCVGAVTVPFTFIALGTGTTTETNNDSDMEAQTAVSGLTILPGTATFTNSTGGTGQGTGASVVSITKTFTNLGSSTNISEAGLFNGTTATDNGIFAHKTFTAVTVATNDQLTVTWTINIGNSTTLN